jgi:hypothetical protein
VARLVLARPGYVVLGREALALLGADAVARHVRLGRQRLLAVAALHASGSMSVVHAAPCVCCKRHSW